jgi:nicotinamidase-related amidase
MRKLLLVIDMQTDFVDGALGTAEAVAIIPSVLREIEKYGKNDIIATRDTHPESYMESREGRYLPVPHCIKGTAGWQIHPEIAPALEGCKVIDKPTFGSTELCDHIVKIAKSEEIEVTLIGLCTDICVVSNAMLIKAALPEINVKVVADACAGVTPDTHSAALTTMKMCQIDII